ncbi:ionic transporter y4hA [Planotetraspora phitsanulokensis]|uniref:Ionic transporter y4hA n=1 Tax=Planotetraspora phitsanulokensis TaxID=575192 RepID=A0A8J3U043_9ACTN|nr:hypothetical protein [Planotetraspora phitsanulokensis]GII35771.1 ionic transporter y4hA [Planotetraspora phitsanulokensis]
MKITSAVAAIAGSPSVVAARVVPVVAVLTLFGVWNRALPVIAELVIVVLLAASVLAAVHHADVVARRVGDLFGALILAVAVTVIEVGLIIALMISGGASTSSLARDTVFAAVMITCNGILGLSLMLGALRARVAEFNPEGTGAALATVITLATLSLVLPSFTTSAPGPNFSTPQLAFAAAVSLVLYALFVFVQNVRHRDSFLASPPARQPAVADRRDGDAHEETPSLRAAQVSLGLLVAALVAVVGLAKVESKTIEETVLTARLPQSVVGVVIALLVLLPEALAAARNARRGRTQISLNLALGSAMASIGLTIPAIAVASIWLQGPLLLGLGPTQMVLLALTAIVGTLTVMPGRATLLQAGLHLVLCAGYLFLAANP